MDEAPPERRTPGRPPPAETPPPLAPPLLDTERAALTLAEVKATQGPPPWAVVLLRTAGARVWAICEAPGGGFAPHTHAYAEWWYVAEGELEFEIEGQAGPLRAGPGSLVLGPPGRAHALRVVGSGPSVRIGVTERHTRPTRAGR